MKKAALIIILVFMVGCLSRHTHDNKPKLICRPHQKFVNAQYSSNQHGYVEYILKIPIYIKLYGNYDGYQELAASTQISGGAFRVGYWNQIWKEKHEALIYPLIKTIPIEGFFYIWPNDYTSYDYYLHIKVDVVYYQNNERKERTKIVKVRIIGVN